MVVIVIVDMVINEISKKHFITRSGPIIVGKSKLEAKN